MKIILRKNVSGLGKEDDLVDVAVGYARNFLIPKGLALAANRGNIRLIEEEKKKEVKRIEKEKEGLENLAKKVETISCTISSKAGDDGKLYGSVTSLDVSEALKKEGIDIDKKKIMLEEPIKSLGIYHVEIKLHPDINSKVKVWVIKG